jgi:hypothetical protein
MTRTPNNRGSRAEALGNIKHTVEKVSFNTLQLTCHDISLGIRVVARLEYLNDGRATNNHNPLSKSLKNRGFSTGSGHSFPACSLTASRIPSQLCLEIAFDACSLGHTHLSSFSGAVLPFLTISDIV